MSNLALTSLLLGVLWAPLLYFGIRHRSWQSVSVVLGVWLLNAVIGFGYVILGRTMSVPWVLFVGYLLIDRLYQKPEHIKHVATSQVTEARGLMHDALSDARAWEAKARTYARLLDEHHIDH